MSARRARRAFALAGLIALVVAALATLSAAKAEAAPTLPKGFQDTQYISGLNQPTAVRFAPDGRIFIAEKAGEIWVYDSPDDSSPTLFADLRKQTYDANDRGLLGMVLDPSFPARPYVYALYTFNHALGEGAPGSYPRWTSPASEAAGGEGDPTQPCAASPGVDSCPVSGRLVRLTAAGDHAAPSAALPNEQVLVEDWCQQNSSHSIGDLAFGPEGALFASGGEGASFIYADYGQLGYPNANQCGDPPSPRGTPLNSTTGEGGSLRSQDILTSNDPTGLDGTVIRIDPDTGEGWPGNPQSSSLDANARRIIATGFRNPYRFAINDETSEVYVGNVGNGTTEEIDRFSVAPTAIYNSGWPCYEGNGRNPDFDNLNNNLCENLYAKPGAVASPFFSYAHSKAVTPEDKGCGTPPDSAISGSTFYEGADFPGSYDGALFFADAVRSCVWVMFAGADGRPDPTTTVQFLGGGGLYAGVDLEVGPDGALYYVQLFGPEYSAGSIHRVAHFAGNQPPVADLTATPEYSPGNLKPRLDASGSTDAEGETLTYEWDLAGNGSYGPAGGQAVREDVEFTDGKNHTVAVRVRDGQGQTSVARVVLYPNDTPPQPVIESPAETAPGSGVSSLNWRVGQAISFSGGAKDPEDGNLAATSLDWSTLLAHCPGGSAGACHRHPLQAFPAVSGATLIAPDHDYPSFIELTLKAVDSRGLAAKRTIKLDPRTVDLLIRSDPAGATLTAGIVTKPGPFTVRTIEGSTISLAAPESFDLGGALRTFQGWSDGGARVHSIIANASTEYLANYSSPPGGGGGPGGPPSVLRTSFDRRPPKLTAKRSAKFAFSASTGRSQRFQCKLDRDRFRPCKSPKTYRGLKPGRHVFSFRPVTADGTPAAKAKRWVWRITAEPPRRRGAAERLPVAYLPRAGHPRAAVSMVFCRLDSLGIS